MNLSTTHIGSFPIGFRLRAGGWQDDLPATIAWARAQGFAALDVDSLPPESIRQILASGLMIGSVDIRQSWTDLCSPDPGKRRAAAQANADYIRTIVPLGIRNFFVVLIPEDSTRDRRENFAFAADGYGQLCEMIAPTGARILIEGWPGRPPHYSTLGCTPAECRGLFTAIGSDVMGINYDPSHLVRLGIDYLCFLDEFAPRIHHVHAKDTRILHESQYEHGVLQPSAVAVPHAFGGLHWRYTIPGQGEIDWPTLLARLAQLGYHGIISIELEDECFTGSEAAEKKGLIEAERFLETCRGCG
ncbi:MAG TPA: sugar phosphate isomerase/epimerase [Tepidisphaeraceae bacterium]|nr:sugar phosphate isomerase/epimerase [Tepidisphaeraceae bacterium]